MPNPLLVPLLRERQFYAALLVGLPLLVFGYAEVWGALVHGHDLDVTATIASLTANPVVVYLGLRQIPRAATVLAIGQERAATGAVVAAVTENPTNPPAGEPTELALAPATPLDGEQVIDYSDGAR